MTINEVTLARYVQTGKVGISLIPRHRLLDSSFRWNDDKGNRYILMTLNKWPRNSESAQKSLNSV